MSVSGIRQTVRQCETAANQPQRRVALFGFERRLRVAVGLLQRMTIDRALHQVLVHEFEIEFGQQTVERMALGVAMGGFQRFAGRKIFCMISFSAWSSVPYAIRRMSSSGSASSSRSKVPVVRVGMLWIATRADKRSVADTWVFARRACKRAPPPCDTRDTR